MAATVSIVQPSSCCTTITWQPRASVAGRPATCPSKVFPGTKVAANIGRVGIFQPLNAVVHPQVISKGAWHHVAPAVRCAATRQLAKCAPEEQGEVLGTSPVVDLFGPAFLSGGTEQVDNAVALMLQSFQEPLIVAPSVDTTLPLADASCHILTRPGEDVEEQILQAHIDVLVEEQRRLEASFQAPHNGPLLLPDSLDLRLSNLSPVATVDEPPPENTIQKLRNMLTDTVRLLGALVLASALALCTPHPAMAARSMGRAGGGGFSSSRSSGGSSRSSSSSSSRSGSSSSSRSSSSSSSRSNSSSSSRSGSSSSGLSSSSSSRRSSSSSGGSSGFGFHLGSTPKSQTSSHSSDSQGHSSGHVNTGGHHPSHSDSHATSGVNPTGGGAAQKSAGKPPRPNPTPSTSGKRRWFGSGSHEPEEPHLNSPIHSDTSASIHLHLSGPTQPHFSSHPGAYHYSDTHDRLLRAFFRSLSGEDRSKETGRQQQPGTEVPRTPKEAAADAEALNATFDDVLTIFAIAVLGFFLIMALVFWLENILGSTQGSFEREDPRDDNTGAVREGGVYAVADVSRAMERTRSDVGKSRAPEGTRVYDFDTNVKNLITIVKIQVALLAQAKSVQLQMDKLCEEAETGSKEGLHHLLTETLLVVLRHSTYWAYGNAQMIPMGYDAAERKYQQIALEERSKAEQETLVNKGGRLTKMPSVRVTNNEPPPNEFIVVTVLAAVKGRLEARDGAERVATRESIKGALQALGQVQAGDLEVLDILWVPQEDDDTLTHAELIESFTDLSPM